jgi:hypothetical protein
MKVRELIEMLGRQPPDEEVMFTESSPCEAFGGDRLMCGKDGGLAIHYVVNEYGGAVGEQDKWKGTVFLYGDLAR